VVTPAAVPVAAPAAAQIPIEQEPVARPVEQSKPAEQSKPVEPSVTPAERPTTPAAPAPVATTPKAEPATPAPPTVRVPTTPEKEKPSSGAGKWFFALIVLAALAAAAYYFLAMRQPPPPPAVGVKISVVKPEDVARSFPTAAVVKKAEPQPLKIEGDGTVKKVVADNTDVQPNAVLVQLDGQDKVNKELADLKDRLNFYRKKLDIAKAKGKQEQERDAQQKISEKEQRLEQVEAIVKKSQLLAPRAGAVSKALVKVGQAVTAGTEVVSFADKALAAEIKIPAIEAQGMKVGQDVQLSSQAGAVNARVATVRTEGEYALVDFALPDDTTAKPGDELKLQKAPLPQVVRLPAAALLEGSKVYVARDGKAAVLPVTVADREGDAVLVQGLPSGEQVITSRPAELHEGVAVRPATEP
jgi:multidrug efflux pump subunit AcrA (membrane-fusion protein)